MRQLILKGRKPAELLAGVISHCPAAREALIRSESIRGQMMPWEAALLYWLATDYDLDGARFLEIGTFHGYSASILAQAARRARIITLNPNKMETAQARKNLEICRNVTVVEMASWDYYPAAPDNLSLVFVDGHHKYAHKDNVYLNRLEPGGVMIWHDYRANCLRVRAAANELAKQLGKDEPDVVVEDSEMHGMAALYNEGYVGWPGVRG